MDTLIRKTGNKRIVECASDRLWATGIPLTNPSCLDDTKWNSQGILGQMLESIRNDSLNCHRGSMSIQYHHPINPSHTSTSSQSLLPDLDMQQHQIGAPPADFSDEMISTMSSTNRLPGESLCGQDSASASTSTSPMSDTTATATDTDPSECPPEEPLRVSDQTLGVI